MSTAYPVSRKLALGLSLICGLGLGLGGCTDDNPIYQPGPLSPEQCRLGDEFTESFEVFERPELVDLWFVVGNSEAMGDYQQALSQSLPPMLEDLGSAGYDVRVAVSTMDGGDDPGLAPRVTDASDCGDNGRQVAASDRDDWTTTAACNVLQGTDGSSRLQPLAVTEQALLEAPESLEGFRREKARLVIVMVGNEDDCSGGSLDDDGDGPSRDRCHWEADERDAVDDWVDDLKATAVTPQGVSLAVISGPPTNVEYEDGESVRRTCSSTLGSGYPSARLYEATRRMGQEGLFLSACVFDFDDHLQEIRRRLIAKDRVSICPSHPMAQEPLNAEAVFLDDGDSPLEFGIDYHFEGIGDDCEEGSVAFGRQGIADAHRVRMTYCRY